MRQSSCVRKKSKNAVFCETRSKRSVEVYKAKNLDPPPPTDVTEFLVKAHHRRDRYPSKNCS